MRPLVNFRAIMPTNARKRYVDDFFNDQYRRLINQNRIDDDGITIPGANIRDIDNGYELELAAPGFDREEFSVEVNDDVLTISGERKTEDHSERPYSRREHNYMTFTRSFALPDTVDEERISASYRNGILHVTIPVKDKNEITRTPRRIDIG